MRKSLLLLFALMATLTGFAQTNLTSGKTVVPLGGLKTYTSADGNTTYTIDETSLQKITVDGNTDNVFLFPEVGALNTAENQAIGIQGFYIDLGESKSIGSIKSTWEGADAGGNIYVTDTEPAADGTLTGETLIATFTNAQEGTKDAGVSVDNSGRYIVFVPTSATNFGWGVKIRTFAAFEKEPSVLTTFEVSPSTVKVNEETELTLRPIDQIGVVIADGVTYTVSSGTLDGNKFTATEVGDITITASYNGVDKTATIKAINVSAPTENPTEPTDLTANVIAVYSSKYNKGINESNPAWGVGGGAPNPLYSSVEEVEIANGHKVVHVKGTGFNSRTAGGVGVTNDYNKIYVALYPFTATQAKIFGDNAYGDAKTVDGLVPGQWNYVALDNNANFPNYVLVELVGETEFYLDHFYFAKPASEDEEAPVLNTAEIEATGIGSIILKLEATDNKSDQITYVVTDQNNTVYSTKGKSGEEITFAIGDLAFETEYTLTIIAKDDNENASDAKQATATTAALIAAPVPTKDAADVISLFSNAYEGATSWEAGDWGQSTTLSEVKVEEDQILKFTNFNYFGFDAFSNDLDLSEMNYLHIDILPMQTMNFGITPILRGGQENSQLVGDLTVGEWNSFDIPLSQFNIDFTNKSFQLKIDRGTGIETVYVDNIYYWKEETTPVEITAISINANETSIVEGKTTQLTVKNQDESTVAANKVTFESSNEAIATVDTKGVVTGVAEGNVTITATLNDDATIYNTIDITITKAPEVPTNGEGSYTIPSGLNKDKELKYTWAFTQTGDEVTVTFSCTNPDEIIGIVDGYVFDRTNGFAEHEGLSYTWTGCTKGQVVTAAHKWMFAEGDFITEDYTYTVKDATTTGIRSLNNTLTNGTSVFDIQGRKVADGTHTTLLPKGIYIVDGKKFIVK